MKAKQKPCIAFFIDQYFYKKKKNSHNEKYSEIMRMEFGELSNGNNDN